MSNSVGPEEWDAELALSADEAKEIIESQCAPVRVRSIHLLGEGWDNLAYEVNGQWIFRFPRRPIAVEGIRTEIAVLPELAGSLPLPVPVPRHVGHLDQYNHWPFFGYKKLKGRESCFRILREDLRAQLLEPMANFLRALHSEANYRRWGKQLKTDPFGRLNMADRIPKTRARLDQVKDLGMVEDIRPWVKIVDAAQSLKTATPKAVVHGDFHFRHILLNGRGRLSGVIDWGDLQVSDPAVDLQILWSFIPPQERTRFLNFYGPVSDTQIKIARVVAIFLSSVLAIYGRKTDNITVERAALQGLAYAVQDMR